MKRTIFYILAAAALVAAFTTETRAAAIASDNAGNYTTWTNGSNGGYGFAPWQLAAVSNSNDGGYLLGDSTTNGPAGGGAGINSPNGRAWGTYSWGYNADAIRPFTAAPGIGNGSACLQPGQSFNFSIDNGYVTPGTFIWFSLENSSGNDLFDLGCVGNPTYFISVQHPDGAHYIWNSPPSNVTYGGINAVFTQGGADPGGGYDYTFAAYYAGQTTPAFTMTGQIISDTISQVELDAPGSGHSTDTASYYYANNFSITGVPDSGSVAPIIAPVLALVAFVGRHIKRTA